MLTQKTPGRNQRLTQRKFADAEAVLQRTKEEAERVTNEAQRAKADAQAARESEAAAKRKLADAEAFERPPKDDAKVMSKANQDLVRDCESGSGPQDSN